MTERTYNFDITAINDCFEPSIPSDSTDINFVGYNSFMETIHREFLPIAIVQTEKIANYLNETFGKYNYTALWEFLRYCVKYKTDEKILFETIKLPNSMWANRLKGGGDCEDFTLFTSGILCNWGIEHEMKIEVLNPKLAHIFVRTKKGGIIDPCNDRFNYSVRFSAAEPFSTFQKEVDLVKKIGWFSEIIGKFT
jgi:hypothetical protein